MSILSNPSRAFPTALVYITVGTLVDIWTILSLIFYPPSTDWGHFLVFGFLVTGIALVIIGLLLGRIGLAARVAELPPAEVTHAVARAEQTAAAHPPVVVPVNSIPQTAAPAVVESLAPPVALAVSTPGHTPTR